MYVCIYIYIYIYICTYIYIYAYHQFLDDGRAGPQLSGRLRLQGVCLCILCYAYFWFSIVYAYVYVFMLTCLLLCLYWLLIMYVYIVCCLVVFLRLQDDLPRGPVLLAAAGAQELGLGVILYNANNNK